MEKARPNPLNLTTLRLLALVAATLLLIGGATAIYGLIVWRSLPSMEARGQFGDLFGALNATFSGLAFSGLLYAIWLQNLELRMQRQELRMQREELTLTRAELARTAEAEARQSEMLLRSAQLNALGVLLESYEVSAAKCGPEIPAELQKFRNALRDDIRRVLADLGHPAHDPADLPAEELEKWRGR